MANYSEQFNKLVEMGFDVYKFEKLNSKDKESVLRDAGFTSKSPKYIPMSAIEEKNDSV